MFSLGTKSQISLKKLDITDFFKKTKFEGFDREFRPRPFYTMFPRSDFFAFLQDETLWIALAYYKINFKITNLDAF